MIIRNGVKIYSLNFSLNRSKNSATQFTPAFSKFGRELEPLQALKREIEDLDKIKMQDTDKWSDKLRRLKIIKEEVQKNLDGANNR